MKRQKNLSKKLEKRVVELEGQLIEERDRLCVLEADESELENEEGGAAKAGCSRRGPND